ncbi:hypothetical protein GPA10_05140 [Streptomyces sp. p1417]|uniref:Uncharacterized protein n=1 Tax=Streptomyces typhae TaxID=2681492 RepID=A0A6L6WVZ7_9ACTN|nr:hypothetical protein [Streptomyces typhae]MVO84171.1 hypothetical protein [Streptomyces typhae]
MIRILISAGGLILALVCIAAVGAAAALAAATWGDRHPHRLTTTARALAVAVAGLCILLAATSYLAEAFLS